MAIAGGPSPLAAASSRWSDLRLRVASAAVLLPVALYCLFAGGAPWLVLVLAATAALAWEWWRLWRLKPGAVPALTLLAGWLYVAVGAGSLHSLRSDPVAGLADVLFLLVVVWSSDIGAYVVGRLVGGPKLAPAISPGKTWSGAAGGLACAMLVGLLVSRAFAPGPATHALVVAAGLSVASQLGDLLESALKRHFGVKDSSRLIPGHGGVFDRLDGVLAAAPMAQLLAMVLGPGVELWR
jgi:phosphatidate cytidylyltransferase